MGINDEFASSLRKLPTSIQSLAIAFCPPATFFIHEGVNQTSEANLIVGLAYTTVTQMTCARLTQLHVFRRNSWPVAMSQRVCALLCLEKKMTARLEVKRQYDLIQYQFA